MRLGQQMRRVWWGNALRGKVPANVQIRWIFSLLDRLMACACIARCFLLSSDVIIQFPVVRFKLASNPRNVFFHRRKFRFCCIQFLKSDYLIAQLWKTSRLGSALAPEIDFALL